MKSKNPFKKKIIHLPCNESTWYICWPYFPLHPPNATSHRLGHSLVLHQETKTRITRSLNRPNNNTFSHVMPCVMAVLKMQNYSPRHLYNAWRGDLNLPYSGTGDHNFALSLITVLVLTNTWIFEIILTKVFWKIIWKKLAKICDINLCLDKNVYGFLKYWKIQHFHFWKLILSHIIMEPVNSTQWKHGRCYTERGKIEIGTCRSGINNVLQHNASFWRWKWKHGTGILWITWFHDVWLIYIWVKGLMVPIHLSLNWQALCAPYQFKRALLLCWSSRWPQTYTLNILWVQTEGAQIHKSKWNQSFTFT